MVIDQPASPRDADSLSERTEASKVTLLLLLGVLYGRPRSTDLLADVQSEREHFDLPDAQLGEPFSPRERLATLSDRYDLPQSFDGREFEGVSQTAGARRRDLVSQLIDDLYRKPDRSAALDIALLSLRDQSERRRVAAAISLLDKPI